MASSARWTSLLLLASAFAWSCADSTAGDGASGGSDAGGAGGAPSAGGSGGGASALADRAPIETIAYADGAGKLLVMQVSVNGSPPFGVLLDTGSDGLRVFEEALAGTNVDVGTTPVSVEFGYGNRMRGHEATARVAFGEVASEGPIDFHLVETLDCDPAIPDCDFSAGQAKFFTDIGVFGILGVSTRRGLPSSIFSPFAQLGPELSKGFAIESGGLASSDGQILFGPAALAQQGFQRTALAGDGQQPNGVAAWRDDAIEACFKVDGIPVDPPCTGAVIDSGAAVDFFYGPNLPAAATQDGALAPAVSFNANVGDALALAFTVGDVPEPSVDLVFVDDVEPFAILGVSVYLRFAVLFDVEHGELGFRSLAK